jgi:hypothetical protein
MKSSLAAEIFPIMRRNSFGSCLKTAPGADFRGFESGSTTSEPILHKLQVAQVSLASNKGMSYPRSYLINLTVLGARKSS